MKKVLFIIFLSGLLSVANAQDTSVVSILHVLDVSSNERIVVKEFPYRIEAPFWTKEGDTLIYNSRGKLYKIDVNGENIPRLIPTGSADRINNDHVLSPNGKKIGISHNSTPDGQSRIYTIPYTGGEPTLITQKGPSYLHGWSPDGGRKSTR